MKLWCDCEAVVLSEFNILDQGHLSTVSTRSVGFANGQNINLLCTLLVSNHC